MNHVYRLVWNGAHGAWVAAPESARARGRGGCVRIVLAALAVSLLAPCGGAWALPGGAQPVVGIASIATVGNAMTVTTNAARSILNWQQFGVNAHELVQFVQPSAGSSVLNRVLGADPSLIYGQLQSNGQVWLVNPAGVFVGPTGTVNTAAFVASSLRVGDADFLAGRLNFQATPDVGSVLNQGVITTPSGGQVVLVGPQVGNEGTITAPNGEVILAAGQSVQLLDTGTPGVSVTLTGDGQATNLGAILSTAGRIGIAGALVRNAGTLSASSAVNVGGQIFLRAGKSAILTNSSVLRADGTKGGRIQVLADMGQGQVRVDGQLEARGTQGDGGAIETSAATVKIADTAKVDTSASGGKTGTWLIDPNDFTIASGNGGTVSDGSPSGDISGATLSAALNSSSVTILSSQGTSSGSGNINVNDAISWNGGTGGTILTLTASNNVNVNANITASGAQDGLALNPNTGNGSEQPSGAGVFNLGAGAAINLPNVLSTSSTALVIGGIPYTVINSLGVEGDSSGPNGPSGTTLQGMRSGHYALGSNIDACATGGGLCGTTIQSSAWNSGAGFAPIGSVNAPFTGVFDGLGHSISGLTINRPTSDDVGLFAAVDSGGVVRNVGLLGESVVGRNDVGGLAGYNAGTISNSYATGSVVGSAASPSSNCNTGMLECNVGGLVGENAGALANDYVTGTVSSDTGSQSTGGLVGENNGTIATSYAAATVNGYRDVGGLVGGNTNSVSDSYALGSVNAVYDAAGGLVGASVGSISNSYATGVVTTTGGDVGGLLGWYGGGQVNNSYWDTTTTGQSSSAGGTGLTTSQLMSQSSYSGWGFSNAWFMVESATRPFLRMEYSTTLSNAHQLQLMAMDLTTSYTLANDLDLTATLANPSQMWATASVLGNTASGFAPVGNADTHFTGSFNGANHSIIGFSSSSPSNYYVGLFGVIDSTGVVENVGMQEASVSGFNSVGALAGANDGTINHVYATGSASGSGWVGALVGNNSGTLSNSYATSNVSGTGTSSYQIGGLAGSNNNSGTISNSYATGSVNGYYKVGGLVGGNLGTITDSYATGDVTGISTSYGTSSAIGGLAGEAFGVISNSYASGSVSGTTDVGGLVGVNFASLASTYAMGSVSGTTDVGGLVGLNNHGLAQQSYAMGSVSGTGNFGGADR